MHVGGRGKSQERAQSRETFRQASVSWDFFHFPFVESRQYCDFLLKRNYRKVTRNYEIRECEISLVCAKFLLEGSCARSLQGIAT